MQTFSMISYALIFEWYCETGQGKLPLEALNWNVLSHPLYSPDIAPSDYYLFRSMTYGLSEQRFHSYEDTKKMGRFEFSKRKDVFFRRFPPVTRKIEKNND